MFKKTADLVAVGTPYSGQTCTGKEATEGGGVLSLKKKRTLCVGKPEACFLLNIFWHFFNVNLIIYFLAVTLCSCSSPAS